MVKTGLKGHHTSLRNTRKTKKMCERFPSHKIINSTICQKKLFFALFCLTYLVIRGILDKLRNKG